VETALEGSGSRQIGDDGRQRQSGEVQLPGVVARADGSFLLKRSVAGPMEEAARVGAELGASLKADAPSDVFA